MATDTIDEVDVATPSTGTQVIVFQPTEGEIAKLAAEYGPLTISGLDDAKGFKAVHDARMVVKKLRVDVEKRRKFLKEDALRYGQRIDAEAKRITGLLAPIEDDLEAKEKAITDERERIKREAAEAEQRRVEAEAKAKRDAEEAALKAEREKLAAERAAMEAEREKIEAAQRAEAERLAAENAKANAERDRLAKEQAELKAAQEKAERAEFERKAKEQAEADARAKVEREAKEAAERKAEQERLANLEAERLEAMRPDVEKIGVFAIELRTLKLPAVASDKAKEFMVSISDNLDYIAKRCESFKA